MTLKCHKCSFENSNNAEKCESCGTILNNTIEISILDDNPISTLKQDSQMHKSSEVEDKLNETGLVLPPEDNVPSDTPPTDKVNNEDGTESETASTKEIAISDDDASREELVANQVDHSKEESSEQDELEIGEDETIATAKMPQLDDEDGLLHIGSVRFRGNLLLTEKDTGTVHRIENEQLDEALIGRLDMKTGFRPQIDFTNVDGRELGVSRRHATINQRGDLIFVTDHNSLNGTYLNGQRLVPEQARVMRDSDTLRIGHVTLIVSFEEVVKGT